MGGQARPQIVRPGAEEAWVEGAFEIPDGLLDDPELAEIARAAAGRRRRDRPGAARRRLRPHQRLRRRALGLGRRPAGAWLAAARVLRPARAPQAHPCLGPARDPRRLRRRRAPGAPARVPRGTRRGAARSRPSSPTFAEREGARERDLDLLRFELAEIEAAAPDVAEAAELAAERERLRHAEGLRLAAGGALQAMQGADEDGGASLRIAAAEARSRGPGRRRRPAGRAGRARRSAGGRAGRPRRRAALLPRRHRGRAGAARGGRGAAGGARPPAAKARRLDRGGARARRALPQRDRAAAERGRAG